MPTPSFLSVVPDNRVNLSLKDKLDYETVQLLGGDGADYTTFFEDFDKQVWVSGTFPSTDVIMRPNWGYLYAIAGNSGKVGYTTKSCFRWESPTYTTLYQYGILSTITAQKFRISLRGAWSNPGGGSYGTGAAYATINTANANFGVGITDGWTGHTDRVVFGYGTEAEGSWSAGHLVDLFAAEANVFHQVDIVSLMDGNLRVSADGGADTVIPWAHAVTSTPQLDLRCVSKAVMELDHIYVSQQRP
jgi:hypothetical protein